MTQEQVAERMEVSRAAVGQWEKDETMPEGTKIPILADLLGITPNDLYGLGSILACEPEPVYLKKFEPGGKLPLPSQERCAFIVSRSHVSRPEETQMTDPIRNLLDDQLRYQLIQIKLDDDDCSRAYRLGHCVGILSFAFQAGLITWAERETYMRQVRGDSLDAIPDNIHLEAA